MTSPEGDQCHGWWRVLEVDTPRHVRLEDGFADDQGRPNLDLPVTLMTVTLTELAGGRTRMSIESRFASTEAMEQTLAMGMEEGITAALGQIDALLAELHAS